MILVCDPCSLQKDRCDQATGDGQSHADVVLGGLHQWGEGCSFGMAKHSTLKLLRFLNWWGVGRNLNGVGKKNVTVNRSSTCFNWFDWVCLFWHNDLGLISVGSVSQHISLWEMIMLIDADGFRLQPLVFHYERRLLLWSQRRPMRKRCNSSPSVRDFAWPMVSTGNVRIGSLKMITVEGYRYCQLPSMGLCGTIF